MQKSQAKITLLGTGTCDLSAEKAASSVWVELEDISFLFDCGRAVTWRLAELGLKNDDIQHIVISHFHPDHVSDLIPLLQAGSWSQQDPRSSDINIYGPQGMRKLIDHLLEYFGTALVNENYKVLVHEHNGEEFLLGSHQIKLKKLPHADNHGIRFTVNGKDCVLAGDCPFTDEEVALVDGAALAVIDSGHKNSAEIVELAVQAQPEVMVCSHLYRPLDQGILNRKASERGFKGSLIVGADLMQFRL